MAPTYHVNNDGELSPKQPNRLTIKPGDDPMKELTKPDQPPPTTREVTFETQGGAMSFTEDDIEPGQ